jgi:hypothetical protein
MKGKLFVAALTLALGVGEAVFSADYGLVLATAGEYAQNTGGGDVSFTGSSAPWFSAALGTQATLYLSGKISFQYGNNEEAWTWPPPFELERTELTFYPVQAAYLTLGRQWFRDSGRMIAQGFFDGFHGSFGLGKVRLTGGAFYTGLLYKKTAEILMTAGDFEYYFRSLDYGDPASYCASRRLFATLAGEFPDLSSRTSLTLAALAQFDLNDYEGSSTLHSQYLEARVNIEALDSLRFAITGIGGLTENGDTGLEGNFAATAGAEWDMPGKLLDMLSAEARWGSGAVNDKIGPFKPINGIAQGSVFAPALPGIMNARVSYTARPRRSFSFSAVSVFFWRTDLETFRDAELDSASKDRFLGGELYGQIVWAPQSALRLSVGGGAFSPGAAFIETTKIRWKINAGLILSL